MISTECLGNPDLFLCSHFIVFIFFSLINVPLSEVIQHWALVFVKKMS